MITKIFIIIIFICVVAVSFAGGYLFGKKKASTSYAIEKAGLETMYQQQIADAMAKADADAKAYNADQLKNAETISYLNSLILILENKRDAVLEAFEKRKMSHLENLKKQGKEKKYKYELDRFLEFKRRVL